MTLFRESHPEESKPAMLSLDCRRRPEYVEKSIEQDSGTKQSSCYKAI